MKIIYLLLFSLFLTACSKNGDLSHMPGVELDSPPILASQAKLVWVEPTIQKNNIQIGQEIKFIATLKNE